MKWLAPVPLHALLRVSFSKVKRNLLFLCFHSEYGDTLRREGAEFCKSWETVRLPDYQQGTLLVQDNGLSLFHLCSQKTTFSLRLCSKNGISNNPSEAELRVKCKKRMAQERWTFQSDTKQGSSASMCCLATGVHNRFKMKAATNFSCI